MNSQLLLILNLQKLNQCTYSTISSQLQLNTPVWVLSQPVHSLQYTLVLVHVIMSPSHQYYMYSNSC